MTVNKLKELLAVSDVLLLLSEVRQDKLLRFVQDCEIGEHVLRDTRGFIFVDHHAPDSVLSERHLNHPACYPSSYQQFLMLSSVAPSLLRGDCVALTGEVGLYDSFCAETNPVYLREQERLFLRYCGGYKVNLSPQYSRSSLNWISSTFHLYDDNVRHFEMFPV